MRENVRAWLVKNEDQIASVRVCLRDGKRLVTVARFAAKDRTEKANDDKIAVRWVDSWDDLESSIVDAIEEHSALGSYDAARLFGYDAAGEQQTTRIVKLPPKRDDDDDDDDDDEKGRAVSMLSGVVRDLAAENTRMLRESSKSIAVLTDALAKREAVTGQALSDLAAAKANEMAAEAKAFESGVVMDTLLSNLDDAEHESQTPEMAVGILQQLLAKVMGPKGVDWRGLADRVANDPDLQARVQQEFADAMARKAAAAAAHDDEPEANGSAS